MGPILVDSHPEALKAQLREAEVAVRDAYALCPCLEVLVPALLDGGADALRRTCVLTPGECLITLTI